MSGLYRKTKETKLILVIELKHIFIINFLVPMHIPVSTDQLLLFTTYYSLLFQVDH